jgi:hypothetical protein
MMAQTGASDRAPTSLPLFQAASRNNMPADERKLTDAPIEPCCPVYTAAGARGVLPRPRPGGIGR